MSYIEAVNSSGGTAVAANVLLASHTPLHVVLVDLRSVRPGLSKKERKIFVLQDLGLKGTVQRKLRGGRILYQYKGLLFALNR
jgi:hypothetical protein